jgi:5-formyltetrahydrofolate cyclo-ligase
MMDIPNDKATLRSQLMHARARLDPARREEATACLRRLVLALPEVKQATTIAAYVSVGREPGTPTLLADLHAAGKKVLLPVLLPDSDLDWALYQGPGSLTPALRGLLEPAGERLGPDAVRSAEVVIVPALAVDRDGMRLGRGGGSYDRALDRVAADRCVLALLYDGELVERLVAEGHDRPVTMAVTPSGVHRFG